MFRNYVNKVNRILKQFRINGNRNIISILCAIGGTATLLITVYKMDFFSNVNAMQLKNKSPKIVVLTAREKRFIRFASVDYDGQVYMTPNDFLKSVLEADPTPRMYRKLLGQTDLQKIKDATPPISQNSTRLFRSLGENGIISYTEYLFLLSILMKPQSGFTIAFNMYDTDHNGKIDKNEFLIVEKIFSNVWNRKRGVIRELTDQEQYVDDEQGLQKKHFVDTTLVFHFFGKESNTDLNIDDFKAFMKHLQREVLELEFNEFSRGLMTISEVDFAKILLRYTYLGTAEYDKYINRLMENLKDTKGITFEDFEAFFQFLKNLEDFTLAIRMYILADHPISEEGFQKAVHMCTGRNLSEHLVHTMFVIFDENGDGLLSYREFIAIMKDRLHRGFKSFVNKKGYKAFKSCVRHEMETLA
ncbi:calcium uptake protein 3, mitochondrial [Leptinotarsa decemlineata]|uniref:calcium uptake protein 3, mitochondrial n=1 Tax=Leptinotarsa decemlineata TaxID=7539 RepID=UPI003D30687A